MIMKQQCETTLHEGFMNRGLTTESFKLGKKICTDMELHCIQITNECVKFKIVANAFMWILYKNTGADFQWCDYGNGELLTS